MKRYITGSACLLLSIACALPAQAEDANAKATPAVTESSAKAAASATTQAHIDEMVYAASTGDNATILSRLQEGIDVNAVDSYQNTALMSATMTKVTGTVKFLLEKGADANQRRASDGWSALILASFFGFDEVVKVLLDAGADVNLANNYGETALFHATSRGQEGCVALLLAHGADPQPKNDKGYDALTIAKAREYTGIAKKIEAAMAKHATK
jgi:ankyrin repeat protein